MLRTSNEQMSFETYWSFEIIESYRLLKDSLLCGSEQHKLISDHCSPPRLLSSPANCFHSTHRS